jgi:hypothetical protein
VGSIVVAQQNSEVVRKPPEKRVLVSLDSAWRRGALEGGFVLVGILGAFAIDAWWDSLQVAEVESVVSESVLEEALANREGVLRTIAASEADSARLDFFLRSSPEELRSVPVDSVNQFVLSLLRATTLEVQTGAVATLISMPSVDENGLALRALLRRMLQEFDDANENIERLNRYEDEVTALMSPYAVPSDGFRMVVGMLARQGPDVLASLRQDPALVDALVRKGTWSNYYAIELSEALILVDSVRGALGR